MASMERIVENSLVFLCFFYDFIKYAIKYRDPLRKLEVL